MVKSEAILIPLLLGSCPLQSCLAWGESWFVELALGSQGPFAVLLKPLLVCFWPVYVIILVVRSSIPALPASVLGMRAPRKKPVISWVSCWGGVVAFLLLLLGNGHCFGQGCVLLHSLCQVCPKGLTKEGIPSFSKLLCRIAIPRRGNHLKDVSTSGLRYVFKSIPYQTDNQVDDAQSQ